MNVLQERVAGLHATGGAPGLPRSALGLVGNTPMIDLTPASANPEVGIAAKLEGFNPGGSIKDRPARQMLLDAIEAGALRPGMTVIEATSGNTGTGLAFSGKVLDIPVTLVVPEVTSRTKLRDMRRFGARIRVVRGHTTEHALEVAYKLRDRNPDRYYMTDQYTNRSNLRAHYLTTGPEILAQCPDVTAVVAAQGSFGTLGGIGLRLAEDRPGVGLYSVVARPGMTTIFGMKESHQVMPLVDDSVLSGRLMADGQSAAEGIRLGLRFGLQLGPSAGAVFSAAVRLSKRLPSGSRIVAIFADTGLKYPGCPLYRPDTPEDRVFGPDLDHAAFTRW